MDCFLATSSAFFVFAIYNCFLFVCMEHIVLNYFCCRSIAEDGQHISSVQSSKLLVDVLLNLPYLDYQLVFIKM